MAVEVPEYMTVGQLMIGLEFQGFCTPTFADFPIAPSVLVSQLKTKYCPSDLTFDILAFTTNDANASYSSVKVFGCAKLSSLVVEKCECKTMGMLVQMIHRSREANPSAGVRVNLMSVLNNPTDWSVFEFRPASNANKSIVFDVKPSAVSKVYLHETTFNPTQARMKDFIRYKDMVNALPSTDEDTRIEFACRCFADGMFDPKYYTFYFVGSECFASKKELLAKWPGAWGVQESDEEIRITNSLVDCCTHIPTVSIKRCYLDENTLKFLAGPVKVMEDVRQKRIEANQVEQALAKMKETCVKSFTRSELVKLYKQRTESTGLL
uniref:Uncharacterized protein n=1 Tax=Clandestinovirus TaxID=2831644 RepID=A0A8F8KNI0_9VIRU|nr:hypothetical protein KOM_12_131 [Clandestinovirus]